MKRFMITYTYRLEDGTVDAWHAKVAEFIAAIDGDAELRGKIAYRCMKAKERGVYYHIAEAKDDAAIQALTSRDFFKRYNEETKKVAGGEVVVTGLETIAETQGGS